MGIQGKIVRMIQTCVQGSKCKVKYGKDESEELSIVTKQDPLSLVCFNIALESIMRETLSDLAGIRMENNQELVVATYADDVIIIAENEEDLKRTTCKLMEKEKIIGLTVNEEKTKYMIVKRYN